MPLPVVVGVAWGRSTSSFHEDAEKWARVGFESRHAFVILCNKSPETKDTRVQRSAKKKIVFPQRSANRFPYFFYLYV